MNLSDMGLTKPEERLRDLSKFGNMVQIDSNIPIRRYYRSGMEMVKMASVYEQENQFENAYILYIKFMVLFLEKIPNHPEYKRVHPNLKQPNQTKIKEVLTLTEKLKQQLRINYQQEYEQFLKHKQNEAILEQSSSTTKIEPRRKSDTSVNLNLNKIAYPKDFPELKSAGKLLLPDSISVSVNKPSKSFLDGTLRTLVIPETLMSKFLQLAESNTKKNIETCGILAGKLASNTLIITHVILPKQVGTSDSCVTMNEEELFDKQDQLNLITLGWIHTHPSQTAFLSSVDLHTHCSYQIMMPEAIAIVCAPKYDSTGFFTLTPLHGLNEISQCRQTGFHPHSNDPALYKDVEHMAIDEFIKLEIIDLRSL